MTIGDSLTHGVSSGAVFHTDLSWAARVATALGVDFTFPTYGGPLDGLPFNIEAMLRQMQESFGKDISLLERIRLPVVLHRIVDANEDYWERGAGAAPPPTATALRQRRDLRLGRARRAVLHRAPGSNERGCAAA